MRIKNQPIRSWEQLKHLLDLELPGTVDSNNELNRQSLYSQNIINADTNIILSFIWYENVWFL